MDGFCLFHLEEGLVSSELPQVCVYAKSAASCLCLHNLHQPSSTSWDSTPGHAGTFPEHLASVTGDKFEGFTCLRPQSTFPVLLWALESSPRWLTSRIPRWLTSRTPRWLTSRTEHKVKGWCEGHFLHPSAIQALPNFYFEIHQFLTCPDDWSTTPYTDPSEMVNNRKMLYMCSHRHCN